MPGKSLTYKILQDHLVEGELTPGSEIGIRIDQTLTQDATGTMTYLQLEAMAWRRSRRSARSATLITTCCRTASRTPTTTATCSPSRPSTASTSAGPATASAIRFIANASACLGRRFSGAIATRPPAEASVCSPWARAASTWPLPWRSALLPAVSKVVKVNLTGKLSPWVTGKDIILELLRRLSVKGGVGKIMEYAGPGVATLPVADRFTATNMGAELGATTSVFPSDELTRQYLKAQGREGDWVQTSATRTPPTTRSSRSI